MEDAERQKTFETPNAVSCRISAQSLRQWPSKTLAGNVPTSDPRRPGAVANGRRGANDHRVQG
jgi:hypothetical protein